jgi:hypothetical protein
MLYPTGSGHSCLIFQMTIYYLPSNPFHFSQTGPPLQPLAIVLPAWYPPPTRPLFGILPSLSLSSCPTFAEKLLELNVLGIPLLLSWEIK